MPTRNERCPCRRERGAGGRDALPPNKISLPAGQLRAAGSLRAPWSRFEAGGEPIAATRRGMSGPTIAAIQRHVAAHYGVEVDNLVSPRRTRDLVRPRHVAMWLCRQLTRSSPAAIGRRFGDRDRKTVVHARHGRGVPRRKITAHPPPRGNAISHSCIDEVTALSAHIIYAAQPSLVIMD